MKRPSHAHSHRREQNPLGRGTVHIQCDFPHDILQLPHPLLKLLHHRDHLLLRQRELFPRGSRRRHKSLVFLQQRHQLSADRFADRFDEVSRGLLESRFDVAKSVATDRRGRGESAGKKAVKWRGGEGTVAEGEVGPAGMEVEGGELLAEDEKRLYKK